MTIDRFDHVRRLAAAVLTPQGLTEVGLRKRFGDPGQVDPGSGQVWRARRDGTSRLVLVLAINGQHATVAPVSIEPTGEDEMSLVLDGASTVFGVDVTVWAGIQRSVPLAAFDRIIDCWSEDVTRWCQDITDRDAAAVPAGARRGRPIEFPFGRDAGIRATLADDLDHIGAAQPATVGRTVPETARQAWNDVETVRGTVRELRERLWVVIGAAGGHFRQLPALTGLRPSPVPLMLGRLEEEAASDGEPTAPAAASAPNDMVSSVRINLPECAAWVDLAPSVDDRGRASLDVRVEGPDPEAFKLTVRDAAARLVAMYPPRLVPFSDSIALPSPGERAGWRGLIVELDRCDEAGTRLLPVRIHVDADLAATTRYREGNQ